MSKEEHIFTKEQKILWWGQGPWVDEPDKVLFEHKGLQCFINRVHGHTGQPPSLVNFGGHLVGYVKLPDKHPWLKDFDDEKVDIHGGITFTGTRRGTDGWIGFDCCHGEDISPGYDTLDDKVSLLLSANDEFAALLKEWKEITYSQKEFKKKYPQEKTYKTIDFVEKECMKLVDQVIQSSEEIEL